MVECVVDKIPKKIGWESFSGSLKEPGIFGKRIEVLSRVRAIEVILFPSFIVSYV